MFYAFARFWDGGFSLPTNQRIIWLVHSATIVPRPRLLLGVYLVSGDSVIDLTGILVTGRTRLCLHLQVSFEVQSTYHYHSTATILCIRRIYHITSHVRWIIVDHTNPSPESGLRRGGGGG